LGLIFSFFFIKEKERKENQCFNIENRTERGGFRVRSSEFQVFLIVETDSLSNIFPSMTTAKMLKLN